MSWGGVAIAGGSIVGGLLGAKGSSDAAKAQEKAMQQQLAFQKWMYEQQRADQAPFREAGLTGQNQLLTLLGMQSPTSNNLSDPNFGRYARDFSMSDFQEDPGYAFRLSEGLKGLDRQAAARGGLISGAALKAATHYGQEMGSQEYGNAFNRYQVNRSNQLNPLFSILGYGQQATNQIQSAGDAYGRGAADSYSGIGNARASGYIGQANALAGGLQGAVNGYMDWQLMNRMGRNPWGYGTPPFNPNSGMG